MFVVDICTISLERDIGREQSTYLFAISEAGVWMDVLEGGEAWIAGNQSVSLVR